ncbi:MAG: HPF/RaiA family ribosome-associated protein [Alphaproteobacteria bacterium]|nr:HPF/RaiA family ribosome-associated protein [Alphaproteobacteria bacterium]MDX5464627.1 HPF/RaiA family ribosome-associated protein [Alphaproteobacteria bacterium]
METPLQITFKNTDPSPAVEARIREKAARLERFYDRITSCRVTVEAPDKHHRKGGLFRVMIDLGVPGNEIVVGGTGPQNHAHEDVYVAVRDSFEAAERALKAHARKMRGDVKAHDVPDHGRVASLFEDHGFAAMAGGPEVYFHRNAVTDGSFDKLSVGDEVRIVVAEKEGVAGPQASAITPVGKHHIVDR